MPGLEKLTKKMAAAVAALMESPTIEAAAGVVGIAPSSLYRWLKLPVFQLAYRAARTEAVDHAVARLQQSACKAVDALLRNTECGKAMAEIAAATAVLDRMVKLAEHSDLAERVEALEQAARLDKDNKP